MEKFKKNESEADGKCRTKYWYNMSSITLNSRNFVRVPSHAIVLLLGSGQQQHLQSPSSRISLIYGDKKQFKPCAKRNQQPMAQVHASCVYHLRPILLRS
jgi:hypothetical protein